MAGIKCGCCGKECSEAYAEYPAPDCDTRSLILCIPCDADGRAAQREWDEEHDENTPLAE